MNARPRKRRSSAPRERLAIIGAGHVGLVYAASFAELGHQVAVLDIDPARIAALRRGRVPFFEPGLSELLEKNRRAGRLTYSSDAAEVLKDARMAFICVPTPSAADGGLDDGPMRRALQAIHRRARAGRPIIVTKSTVSVGMNRYIRDLFRDRQVPVVSNPEYLREGHAIHDFLHPHRIVLGSDDPEAAAAVAKIYDGIEGPVFMTDPVTAELSKLASNAFLALKISFANSVARVALSTGGDIAATLRILGADPRIGAGHLRAGLGFGGACLPKDLAAMEHLARRSAAPYELFAAAQAVNRDQLQHVLDLLLAKLESLSGRRIAILGIAFKPDTDDIRESPSLALVSALLDARASVVVHDPIVKMPTGAGGGRAVVQRRSALVAAKGADAVVLATDWAEYGLLSLHELRRAMKGNVLIDARGILDPVAARKAGLDYTAVGSTDR